VLATWEPNYSGDEMIYTIRLLVYDTIGQVSEDLVVIELDMPPLTPEIYGNTSGSPDETIEFTFGTTDPNNDWIFYYIDWGDGEFEDRIGPKPSGKIIKRSHSWDKKSTFIVRCMAKDISGLESPWGELEVIIPRNKVYINSIFLKYFEDFCDLFPILKMMFLRFIR
jgi:hypothetical protein